MGPEPTSKSNKWMRERSVEERAFEVELEGLVVGLPVGFVTRYFRGGRSSKTYTVPSEST